MFYLNPLLTRRALDWLYWLGPLMGSILAVGS
jgi:hypothetical protein